MINLSSYLEKFKNLKDPKEDKATISNIILETAQIHVPEEEILVKMDILYIQSSPLVKNRIFIMKEVILKKIEEIIHSTPIKDIK